MNKMAILLKWLILREEAVLFPDFHMHVLYK